MCKLEGASFWEKTPGADYLPHNLTLPEGNENKIHSDVVCGICGQLNPFIMKLRLNNLMLTYDLFNYLMFQ